MSNGALVSGFFSFIVTASVSGGASMSDGAPVSSVIFVSDVASVFGFSSSVKCMPGSDFSSFIGAITVSGFSLYDSSRFSALDAGL